DQWQIINVAALIKNNHDILFVLVGDGMEKLKLKKTAHEKQLYNIQFIDSIPKNKIPALVRAADVCTAILSPVFTTTYPNKVFDYLACAKPIILPIDGAIREMAINRGKAGIFVPPGDAEKFKNAIIELKNNPEKSKNFGKNGYKFVIENFDREKLATKYLKIIQRLIDKNFPTQSNPYQTYQRYKYAWDLVPYKTENFLDFGCYDGEFIITLKNKAQHLFATDVNGESIQNGKQKYPWIDFSMIKNGKTKFANNFFDVITLLDVLEHVINEKETLDEIYRILKPGGKLILSTPYKGLFAWADVGNIKFRFPHIHKFIYIHILKQADIYHKKFIDISNGLMGDISVSKNMFHKHYNLKELKNILEPHLKIIYFRRFGLIQPFFRIIQYLYKLIYKNRSELLIKIISFDQKINWGAASYNIIIVTKKD
ncbi:glycosyltransferase, partial [Patescibacteria group bacterium]|nr:glycosyltransferase [Patescibacteria group bacterium]